MTESDFYGTETLANFPIKTFLYPQIPNEVSNIVRTVGSPYGIISEENTTVVAEKVHLATTKIVEQIEREWEFLTAAAVDGGKHTQQSRYITVSTQDSLYNIETTSSKLDKITNN